MKVYLAGKVTKNGWRTNLVSGAEIDAVNLPDDDEWPVLKGVIFGEHDYVGPFLYGCDHGCYHGRHGMSPRSDLDGDAGGVGCGGEGGFSREEIVRRCLDAVRRSDLVFCWLEAPEDYGSMIEVGFALALGKKVIVGAQDFDLIESHWFATDASFLIPRETPEAALRLALERVQTPGAAPEAPASVSSVKYGLPIEAWRRCESPIERALLAGVVTVASRGGIPVVFKLRDKDINLTVAPGTPMIIWPQYHVCAHRTDFMVEFGKVKAVVECDGHDYHERTKKQAERDRGLDRAFQREGFRVFRFTGSEIWQGPEACAAALIRDMQSAAGG
jgi:hypothetical protein